MTQAAGSPQPRPKAVPNPCPQAVPNPDTTPDTCKHKKGTRKGRTQTGAEVEPEPEPELELGLEDKNDAKAVRESTSESGPDPCGFKTLAAPLLPHQCMAGLWTMCVFFFVRLLPTCLPLHCCVLGFGSGGVASSGPKLWLHAHMNNPAHTHPLLQ